MACRSPLRIIRAAKSRAEEHHLGDVTLGLHLHRAHILAWERLHLHLLVVDSIEARFVRMDRVETRLGRLAITVDLVEDEVTLFFL